MLDHRRIKHKGLKKLVRSGDESGLQASWVSRCKRILNALDVAVSPSELDVPGYRFHELKGALKGTYSVRVTGNWRMTFRWDEHGPFGIDLEDYHGK